MKQLITTGIILRRTDYGEADRILTLLTPDCGKLSLLAKGVRRIKSKMAGGIELFSISEITYIRGRSDLGTLVSARLLKYYGHIVGSLDRTMLGYDLIKELNRITEDQPEPEYFELLSRTFAALDDATIPTGLIRFWFGVQLLRLGGHTPNLHTDTDGRRLTIDQQYEFAADHMAFAPNPTHGRFDAVHIKFLRLGFAGNVAKVLANVQGYERLLHDCEPLVAIMKIDR
jgi:DNA repair protein RecO (recombination protein O)